MTQVGSDSRGPFGSNRDCFNKKVSCQGRTADIIYRGVNDIETQSQQEPVDEIGYQ